MAGPRPIRWLHLSDLHLGCRGEDLWWQVQEVLERSIRSLAERVGPPDLLLISGDLTNTGAPKEFGRVDRFLDTLLGWLGCDPLVVAVPGNHDLQRPQGMDALFYRVLERYALGRERDGHPRRFHVATVEPFGEREIQYLHPKPARPRESL